LSSAVAPGKLARSRLRVVCYRGKAMGAWFAASARRRWMLAALVVLAWAGVACVPSASAMNFLVQGLHCSEECFTNGFYKGSTLSEGLEYLELEGGFPEGAALSSDGEQIAWTEHSGGLFLSEIEARRTTTLVRYRDINHIGMVWHYDDPVFAPEQDRVIFNWYAHCFQESCEPFTITSHEELHFSTTAGEDDPIQVSSWPSAAQEPAISSDGGHIAFVSSEE
jgi:hypothetical protein